MYVSHPTLGGRSIIIDGLGTEGMESQKLQRNATQIADWSEATNLILRFFYYFFALWNFALFRTYCRNRVISYQIYIKFLSNFLGFLN